MSNPFSRVLTALTFIEGDRIDSWKENELEKLTDRVTSGVPETSELHWQIFKDDFNEAFTNTNEKQEAYQNLTRLEQGDSLDHYVVEFKRLAKIAKLDLDERGTIEIFKASLKHGLMKAIIRSPHFDPLQPWETFDRWVREVHAQHLKWKMGLQYSTKSPKQVKHALYQALKKKGNNQRTTSQGGNAIDVDAAHMGNLTEAQKANLIKENKCFYCQKTGHRANICYKKKRDRGEVTATSQVNVADTSNGQTKAAKTMDGIIGKMTDEEKLKLVEDLLPKDFLQGTD
jgi:hypothetical protein